MILYRPVGLQELTLIYDSGMKAFPARLPKQPIFYPVLQLEYARKTASSWNTKHEQSAGYVTQFKVEDEYIAQFEKHTVGKSQNEEFWIPAEEMETFNQHIVGPIKVLEAYFGDAFQGFIPDQFELQGKNAVEQFTLLSNSYIYKRMDFYLELKRNHKAVFLNYPFWQKFDFKNPGLKEKVLKAIKEAWFTSFPKTPLVTPMSEDPGSAKQVDEPSSIAPVQEEVTPAKKQQAPKPSVEPVQKKVMPVRQSATRSLPSPASQDATPAARQRDSKPAAEPVQKETTPVKPTNRPSYMNRNHENTEPVRQIKPQPWRKHDEDEIIDVEPIDDTEPTTTSIPTDRVPESTARSQQPRMHFEKGIKFGLSGMYHDAIDALSKAVDEDPNYVTAHTSLGIAFHRLEADDRALACYETALKIAPDNPEAHYFRANILYGRGAVREAIAEYTTAVGLNPELIEAHEKPIPDDRLTDYTQAPAEMYRIARSAHRIIALTKSLETNPKQANRFKERAAEYSRLWNYEQAIADYSSFLELQPGDAQVLHLRGLAYEQVGQQERALKDYEEAATSNPQLSDVYIERGVTFGKMGNFRQSLASLSEGIRLTPQNPDGYFNRGMTYFQQGDFESAIRDFSNVIQLSPRDDGAYYWRGLSNEEVGRRQDALADYRQFLALSQDPGARGEVEQKLRRWNAGRQKTNQPEAEQPDRKLDLHDLIVALGERALHSTWFGVGVQCVGEKTDELYALVNRNRPIQGRDLLQIAAGISQTVEGDFTAFDPEAVSHWLFIRAWSGSGFYIEINDLESKERLKSQFQWLEEVEGAYPPYESLFVQV